MPRWLSILIIVLLSLLAFAAGRDTRSEPRAAAVPGPAGLSSPGVDLFPLGFTKAPPPDGQTPEGNDAYAELATNGAVFHRCGPPAGQWGPAAEAALDFTLDRSAAAGVRCAIYIPDLTSIAAGDIAKQTELRRVVNKYKAHAGLGYWKGQDEPELGRVPVDRVQRFYDIVHELDSQHPVWITQAPRGTIDSLKQYDPTYDIGTMDIYPVSYPPGLHSDLPNKNISVVGDYAQRMGAVTEGLKPFWMVLQIAWSGVTGPGKTLRFPTFPEERYMAYQAIISGARGLVFFGGDIAAAQTDRDKALGWNWKFYRRVLRPVLREFHPAGPLYPALIAPDSDLPVQLAGADDIEFVVREAGNAIFILAAKREGATVQVAFSGLPEEITSGDVLFEEPRKVSVSTGGFTDWFSPNEVHVYRFRRPASAAVAAGPR